MKIFCFWCELNKASADCQPRNAMARPNQPTYGARFAGAVKKQRLPFQRGRSLLRLVSAPAQRAARWQAGQQARTGSAAAGWRHAPCWGPREPGAVGALGAPRARGETKKTRLAGGAATDPRTGRPARDGTLLCASFAFAQSAGLRQSLEYVVVCQ